MDPDRNRSAGFVLLLLAPVLMLGWVAYRNTQEDAEAAKHAYQRIVGTRTDAESGDLDRLLSEAFEVLRSPAFHANLRRLDEAYPRIYARRGAQEMTPDEVAALVSLEAPGSRYAPVQVLLTGGDDPMDLEREEAEAGEGPGSGRFADMTLGRGVLDQWRSGDVVRQSCAINVAAHEYAHTISITPVKFLHAFTDTTDREPIIRDRRHPESPVGSYFIGAVAQCTWLEQRGRLGPGGLRACVEVFGVRGMNYDRCGAFPDGAPVEPRPGLPPANPPL